MELKLDDETLKTRTDASLALKLLQSRVDNLARLIETRMQQESIGQEVIFHFKSRWLQQYADMFLREKSIQHCFVLVGIVLGIFTCLEHVSMTQKTLSIIAYVFAGFIAASLALLIYTTIEQISRLLSRTARLKTMIMLYLSTMMMYALLYTMLVTARPNSLVNVSTEYYFPALVVAERFVDTLYFSAINQSTIGFGDVVFTSFVGRIFTFTQSLISVAFMSILFSNWIS